MNINPFEVTFTPLAGSTFSNLLRLMAQNKFRVHAVGMPRMLYSLLMSFVLSPLNVIEKIRFDEAIKATEMEKPPIFIIGHWRSGTTYLHNLLSQDESFAYPTTFQTVTPGLFLGFEKLIKPIVAASLPPTRPQDDIALGADLPQEEEYALGNLSPFSFYNGWCFPQNMAFYYRFVCMENVSKQQVEEWKDVYRYFLQKVTHCFNGKQLLVKNPANTARVKLLLEMFPEAKFIHIYRNPYHTLLSMKRNIEAEMTLYCVQKPKDQQIIEQLTVDLYNRMHEKLFSEQGFIPPGNFVEITYEDLTAQPLDTVRHIYDALALPRFEQVKPKLEQYINMQASAVRPHHYAIDERLRAKIYSYVGHIIDRWGYEAPHSSPVVLQHNQAACRDNQYCDAA